MARLRNRKSQVIVNVADDRASALGPDWELLGASAPSGSPALPAPESVEPDAGDAVDYNSLKVAELRDLIEARNADRPEDEQMSTAGKKADLVAALEADDE